jgi:hypothetical protein
LPGSGVRRSRPQPLLEQLEDRALPTVVFTPRFGPEVVHWGGNGDPPGMPPAGTVVSSPLSSNPYVLQHPTVYFIFWGPKWTQTNVQPMLNAAKTLIGSQFLSGLSDYGSDGPGTVGGYVIDNSPDPAGSNPVDGTKEINKEVPLTSWTLPGDASNTVLSPIYVTVFDTLGPESANPLGNGPDVYQPRPTDSPLEMNHIWVAPNSITDSASFSSYLSHELAERIFAGTGGLSLDPPPNSPSYPGNDGNNSQISDNEPDAIRYDYIINGPGGPTMAQAYWSISHQAYVVPDGNTEQVLLHPIWTVDSNNNATFDAQYDMEIDGDAGVDNVITIDSTSATTTVVFNYQTFSFKTPSIASITVNPGAGANTVNVQEVVSGLTVTVNTSGSDEIEVGKAGDLSGIHGPVKVQSSVNTARSELVVDDSRDSTARTMTEIQDVLTSDYDVRFAGLGTISYTFFAIDALQVDGGTGKNTINILSTSPGITTTLDTGFGNDSVNVQSTTGALDIISSADNPTPKEAQDKVTVGGNAPALGGVLEDILGAVSVSNSAGATQLVVDDSGQVVGANYTMTATALTNTSSLSGPAPISYGRGVTSLEFHTGGDTHTISVEGTGPATTIDAGTGTDTIAIGDVGDNVNAVAGPLTVNGNGKTVLTVDDSGNVPTSTYGPISVQYLIAGQQLTRVAQAFVAVPPVGFILQSYSNSIKFGRLSSLTVDGGSVGVYTYEVNDTGGTGGVTLNTGNTANLVGVGDSTDNINGVKALTVNGAGDTTLTVNDSDNAITQYRGQAYVTIQTQYTASANHLSRRAIAQAADGSYVTFAGTIQFGGLTELTIDGGPIGTYVYKVDSTIGTGGLTINAASAQDAVMVGDTNTNINGVTGLTVNGNGNTTLLVDDRGNKPTSSPVSTYTPLVTQYTIGNGSLSRLATYFTFTAQGGYTVSSFSSIAFGGLAGLTINGGPVGASSYQVNGTGGAGPVTINATGPQDAVTVGDPNTQIDAVTNLSVNGNGKTTLTVDDRGNQTAIGPSTLYIPVTTEYDLADGQLTRVATAIVSPSALPQPQTFVGTVAYQGLAGLTLDGGSTGAYVYHADSTSGAKAVTLNDAGSGDVVAVGDAGRNLDSVVNLSVNGDGSTVLSLDDEANRDRTVNLTPIITETILTSPTFLVTGQSVKRTNVLTPIVGSSVGVSSTLVGTVSYQNVASLSVQGGQTANVFDVQSTAAATPTTITAGNAGDTVKIGDASHNLDGVGTVTVHGGTGTVLTLDDEANHNRNFSDTIGPAHLVTDPTYTVSDGLVTRSNVVTITYLLSGLVVQEPPVVTNVNYDHLAGLTLQGGQSDDVFNVQGTTAGTPVVINTGAGTNTTKIGGAIDSLDDIQSTITVSGQGEKDSLNVNDSASPTQADYEIFSDHVARTPVVDGVLDPGQAQTFNFTGEKNVALTDGTAFEVVGVDSVAAGTSVAAYGGAGRTEFIVDNAADTLDDIHGTVALHGAGPSDLAIVDDYLNPVAHTYTLNAGRVQRDGISDITYDGLGEMIVNAADNPYVTHSPNTVNVLGTSVNTATAVTVGAGDVVTLGAPVPGTGTPNAPLHTLQGFLGAFSVESPGSQAATVVIDDSGDRNHSARTVTLDSDANGGYFLSGITPAGYIGLPLGTGSSLTVNGSAADETFAVKAVPPGVQVRIDGGGGNNTLDYSGYTGDICVNLLLGKASALHGGIANFENVIGSIGNDLLVGDAKANILVGGTGRNVIIGDAGADRITGGGGDNLLVGGSTIYDGTVAALDLIMQEWTSPADYPTRMNAIATGTDLLAGSGVMLNVNTVIPDGRANVLIPGHGNNWVFP